MNTGGWKYFVGAGALLVLGFIAFFWLHEALSAIVGALSPTTVLFLERGLKQRDERRTILELQDQVKDIYGIIKWLATAPHSPITNEIRRKKLQSLCGVGMELSNCFRMSNTTTRNLKIDIPFRLDGGDYTLAEQGTNAGPNGSWDAEVFLNALKSLLKAQGFNVN